MHDELKISIITPNYNYAGYIGKTIESILGQDYPNWEHIIVDDGSTDNSVEVISKYAGTDSRIRLIRQENSGQTKALNKALKSATGEIVGWINSDDWYEDNVFRMIADHFESRPDLDICFGDGYYYMVAGDRRLRRKQLPFNYELFAFNGFCNSVMSNTVFWKRKLHDRVGFFNEQLNYNMDGELFARLFWRSKVIYVPEPIAYFRWHENAKTIKNRSDKKSEILKTEVQLERQVAFGNLGKSDLLETQRFDRLRKYYKMKRVVLRFLRLHYFQLFFDHLVER